MRDKVSYVMKASFICDLAELVDVTEDRVCFTVEGYIVSSNTYIIVGEVEATVQELIDELFKITPFCKRLKTSVKVVDGVSLYNFTLNHKGNWDCVTFECIELDELS